MTIDRFIRQMIIPGVGVEGQSCLARSSVLIIGTGGLGSPCALYLAAAGVGRIGLVDYDKVELHNLHRQIMHREATLGQPKVVSAASTLVSLYSALKVDQHAARWDKDLADQLTPSYDVLVDASDNVPTRYLANDAACKYRKPLVSGSALRWEGHLCTFIPGHTPCYRCLYPTPPPTETVTNCDAGGIMGPVTGVIGSMQALEVIKLLLGQSANYSGKMLIFDAQTGSMKVAQLRSKSNTCLCATPEQIQLTPLSTWSTHHCHDKTGITDSTVKEWKRITVHELVKMDPSSYTLIDVRPGDQFKAAHLPQAIHIPLDQLKDSLHTFPNNKPVVTICRRGNASQTAAKLLCAAGLGQVSDVIGGMTEYAMSIDQSFLSAIVS